MNWESVSPYCQRDVVGYEPPKHGVPPARAFGNFSLCRVMVEGGACYELWRKSGTKGWEMLEILGPIAMNDIPGRQHIITILRDTAESLS
jgi:hypothetical protein